MDYKTRSDFKINYHYIDACDMRCCYCFRPENKCLEKEKIVNTFENLCKLTSKINLVGGETFMNLDLLYTLVSIGIQNKVDLSIVTNGLYLSKFLRDDKVNFILKNISMLGISIDSFNRKSNLLIGRNDINGETLEYENIQKIRDLCTNMNIAFKINTVVSQLNLLENMKDFIRKLHPNKWKILQVVTDNDKLKVSNDEFDKFVYANEIDNIEIRVEDTNLLTNSYIIFNSDGVLYHKQEYHHDFNINKMFYNSHIEETMSSFYEGLTKIGFDSVLYNSRYIQV